MNYVKMECRTSLKIHILDKFMENMGDYSGGQDERFYQYVLQFKRCCQGYYNEKVIGDYIWELL